jgi:hypothetical protein
LAELERPQRQSRDVSDQGLLRCRRDELLGISQTFRPRQPFGKKAELLGQAALPSRLMDERYMGTKSGFVNILSRFNAALAALIGM